MLLGDQGHPTRPALDASTSTFALLLCSCAALLEGFDNQSLGVAAPRLFAEFHLHAAQGSLLFTATTAGLAIGAVVGGYVADRKGRRFSLVVSLLLFGACSFLTATSTTLPMLLLARLLTGLGLGGAMPNSIAISAESVAPERRLRVVSTVTAALPLGGAIAGLISLGQSLGWSWRSIFYVGGVAPIVLALVCQFSLPARAPASERALDAGERIGILFARDRVKVTSLLWMGFFFMHLMLLLLLNWLPTLFIRLGFSPALASWSAVAFNICGSLLGALLARLQGGKHRAVWVLITYVGMAVALVLLAEFSPTFGRGIFACGLAGAFVIGGQLILYALAPVCYPFEARGTGVGAAVAVGRIGSVVGPAYAGALLTFGVSGNTVLLAILPFVAISGIAAFALTRQPLTSAQAPALANSAG